MAKFNLDDYIPVNERIIEFYKRYEEGSIQTEIVDHDEEYSWVIMRAYAYRDSDDKTPCVGHAQEWREKSNVSKFALIENAETSCIGRALAARGIEVSKSIASREEVLRAQQREADSKIQDAIKVEPVAQEDYKEKLGLFKTIKSLHTKLGVSSTEEKNSLLAESGVAESFNDLDMDGLKAYIGYLESKITGAEDK
jgi:hypothetical protein